MSTEFFEYCVAEPDFGASSSIAVKIKDGTVVKSFDTSTKETNYVWDRGFEDGLFVGDTAEEMHQKLNSWFDDFNDEYRRPYIIENSLTRDDWKSIEFQKAKEKMIAEKIEHGSDKREQRFVEYKKNKDMLAEKARVLDAARPKKAHSTAKERADARVLAYKKFVMKTR